MTMWLTTWRKLILGQMAGVNRRKPAYAEAPESFDEVVAIAPPDLDLDREFDGGFGSVDGKPFTLWTRRRVYFPTEYDGAEDVQSVPRDPCDEVTVHD